MKYTTKFILLIMFVSGLLFGLSIVYAIDPQPRPGIPGQPVPELPKVYPPKIPPTKTPPMPDLIISPSGGGLGGLFDLYPDNPGMGPSQFWVGGQVLNGGRAAVRGCEVDVLLSIDRKISSDDRLIETIVITETIPPAEPGRYGAVVIPRRVYSIIGLPTGTYFICTKVDPRNRIIETDENNNDNCDFPIRIHPAGAK